MLKLIIVEDEDLLREGLSTCIDWNELGYELVGTAEDGVMALELISEINPDIIISDIKMPHMNGLELAEYVNENFPSIRMVIISGYDDFEYAKKAITVGVCEYILKPINLDELYCVMKKLRENVICQIEKEREFYELKEQNTKNIEKIRYDLFLKIILHKQKIQEITDYQEEILEYFNDNYYAVGIIESPNYPILSIDSDYLEVIEMDKSFEKMIVHKMDTYKNSNDAKFIEVLHSNNCERLICVFHNSMQNVKNIINDMHEIFENDVNGQENLQLQFGNVLKGLNGLYKSFLQARKYNEDNLIECWSRSMNSKGKDKFGLFMDYDLSNLFYEIRSGTANGIEKEINELCESVKKENIVSYMQLMMIINNIFFQLVKLPEETGGNINSIIDDPGKYYRRIIEKHRRTEMFEELKCLCLTIHEYFAGITGTKVQGILKRIEEYMEENYMEERLCMKDVAKYAYVSVTYLGIILKKETGKTFIEYLTEIRIEKAKQFLRETNMKNYEIANACGYSTPTYFSTVFKEICGISPSLYRKQYQDL